MLKNFFKSNRNKAKITLIVIIILLIISGFFYAKYTWNKSLTKTSEQALNKAEISAIGLNGEMLKQLRGVSEDIGTIPYDSLKKRLIELKDISTNVTFVYFYTERDGKLYFMVDSEKDDSPDLAPAGMEYIITGTEYSQPFESGFPIVTKPATDEWGTWVSVLIPIKNTLTNEVTSVFAMDYPASIWSEEAFINTRNSVLLFLGLILFSVTLYIIYMNNIKRREGDKKYKYLFENSKDAVMTIYPPDWKFSDGNPASIKIYGLKDIDELRKINPGDVSPERQPDGELSSEKSKEMINLAIEKGSNSFEWVHKRFNGPEFLAKVSLVKVETGKDVFLQAVVHDITEERKSFESIKESEEKLKKMLDESERSNRLMVGRELEMINLKKEIAELKNKK